MALIIFGLEIGNKGTKKVEIGNYISRIIRIFACRNLKMAYYE